VAVLAGVLLGLLGFLALLAWLIYLALNARTTHLNVLVSDAITLLVIGVAVVIKWREDKRFALLVASWVLVPASDLARTFVPSWPWVPWVGYAYGGVYAVILIMVFVRSWRRRRRMERRLNPWHFKVAKD
jgi:uncharacterized membrane protein YfcA